MSACAIPIATAAQAESLVRTCPTCKLRVANQFVGKCPRCASKLSLANLCVGCYQNGACHTDETAGAATGAHPAKPIQVTLPAV